MAPVGAERHAVDRLLVFGQRVDADAPVHVPEPDRGVEGRAVETRAAALNGASKQNFVVNEQL